MTSYNSEILFFITIAIIGYGLWIYNNHLNKVKEFIHDYYNEKDFIVENITNLNISEKVKYRTPIVLYHHFFNYSFPLIFLRLNTFFYRKVNLINDRNKKQTAYIELKVRVKDNIEIEELKVFEL